MRPLTVRPIPDSRFIIPNQKKLRTKVTDQSPQNSLATATYLSDPKSDLSIPTSPQRRTHPGRAAVTAEISTA